MRLVLIRHGRTTSNQDFRLDTAEPGADLDELGKEQAEQLVDLPILQTIPLPPRELPFSVRLYLRLCSTSAPIIGWFVAGFGFIFALAAVGFMGLDDAIPRIWSNAGKVTITDIEEANLKLNDRKVYAYHFEMTENDVEKITGISYGYNGIYKTGDEVVLYKSGKRYRVQNLSLTPGGTWWWFPLVFLGAGCLFGIIGLCFPIYSWFAGGKAIQMLQYGTAVGARYLGMNSTGVRVNDQSVMKVNFEYQVAGETYTASAQALNISRLTDAKHKVVFYDPVLPERSVVLDGLPSGIHLDELTGRFWSSPLRCFLPLLAAAIVCGQIVAIVVLALRAI